MKEPLRFKRYVNWVFLGAVLALFVFKAIMRPWVRQNDFHEAFTLVLNSLPNFLEAVVGVPLLTIALFSLRHRYIKRMQKMSERSIYFIATILAAVYVITRELKIHNLGGNNIYDPNDVVASVIGLLFMWALMLRYGFVKSESADNQSLSD